MNNTTERPDDAGAMNRANPEAPQPAPSGSVGAAAPNDKGEIRIDVAPGATVALPPSFGDTGEIVGKVGEGNLALKSGDITVILQGYVEANQEAPITVETADGSRVDVAAILAATDPNLDIETAAGPAAGAQAPDSGHFLAAFGGALGLGGLNAVGPLDQTELSYKLIDNSIRRTLTDEEHHDNNTETPGNNPHPPTVTDSDETVDEAGLPCGGSQAPADSETTTGFILVTAPEGLKSITIDGTPVDLTDPSKTGPIAGDYGELTVIGWNPVTGELDYSYTLKDNLHHDPIQGPNLADNAEDFPVVVTDKDGQTADGDITIDIKDDVPTACADIAITCGCGNASGNVLTNDTPGADGIVAIVTFKDGAHVYQLDGNGALTSNDDAGNYSYDQATGVLEIFKTSGGGSVEIDLTGDHTGDYAYVQGAAIAADAFQYTVIDGDGDTSTAALNILPDLSPPIARDDHIFSFEADFTIANAWLLNNDQPENKIAVSGTSDWHQLTVDDLVFGALITLDPGATEGSFDYEIESTNGKTDSGSVAVNLVTDCSFDIDQSKSTADVILLGDYHDNTLSGGSGADVLVGGGGKDQLNGNGGNDDFYFDHADRFDGGAGTDRIAFGDPVTGGFDAGFTTRVQSIEVLDFRNGGADTMGAGKDEALSMGAVLQMTDGKGELWIAAESGDSFTLGKGFTQVADVTNMLPADGIANGTYSTFTASDGLHNIIVHVDTQASVVM